MLRRLIDTAKEFSSLLSSIDQGYVANWTSKFNFVLAHENENLPVLSNQFKYVKPVPAPVYKDISCQCDPAEEIVVKDFAMQFSNEITMEVSDASVQCLLVENKVTSSKHSQTVPLPYDQESKKHGDIDSLSKILKQDFSKIPRADLLKTRTELLMELCWTDQAIKSRREFLFFTKNNCSTLVHAK